MNWTCPHCGALQVVSKENMDLGSCRLSVGEFRRAAEGAKFPKLGIDVSAIRCAHADCREVTVAATFMTEVHNRQYSDWYKVEGSEFFREKIYPHPSGKPFPNAVPDHFLKDYKEAWAIINLSPKSSATLARRCLQGMIRDFCGIKERTLFDEIKRLEEYVVAGSLPRGVDQDTIEAMRAVKDIGNIGAHMTEVDGVIVDVDPDEAETLLSLIEMLFSDWYLARAKREEQLAKIVEVKKTKLPATGQINKSLPRP